MRGNFGKTSNAIESRKEITPVFYSLGPKGEWKRLVYRFIQENRASHSIVTLCQLFGVSRSSVYRYSKRVDPSEEELRALIQECHSRHRQTYGYRRVKMWLQRAKGIKVNSKRILRIMQKYSLLSIVRRRKKKILIGKENLRYPNLISQKFTAARKNENG